MIMRYINSYLHLHIAESLSLTRVGYEKRAHCLIIYLTHIAGNNICSFRYLCYAHFHADLHKGSLLCKLQFAFIVYHMHS